jgi:hypothetical protein
MNSGKYISFQIKNKRHAWRKPKYLHSTFLMTGSWLEANHTDKNRETGLWLETNHTDKNHEIVSSWICTFWRKIEPSNTSVNAVIL